MPAVWDEDEQRWISDAQIAETSHTAFEGTRHEITARLVVRRVKRLDPNAGPGQGELFACWRYHAVFTDSPFLLEQAEAQHRGHVPRHRDLRQPGRCSATNRCQTRRAV